MSTDGILWVHVSRTGGCPRFDIVKGLASGAKPGEAKTPVRACDAVPGDHAGSAGS